MPPSASRALVRPSLDDAAPVENDEGVHAPDRRQAVRDDDCCPPSHQRPERALDQRFALGIERARRFVEDQNRRVLQDRARDRDALALAARELDAALTHECVVAVGQRLDELCGVRERCGTPNLLVGGVRPREADVVRDRAVEHRGILRHIRYDLAQRRLRDVGDRLAADEDLAALDVLESEQESRDGGLAAAGASDEPELRPRRHGERELFEQERLLRRMPEADVTQFDAVVPWRERNRRADILDRGGSNSRSANCAASVSAPSRLR